MDAILSKTGVSVETVYCRKCRNHLSPKEFYECADAGLIDTNGYMSVCKSCIQSLYDSVYEQTNSLEKTIHKLCISLNIRYSNEAVSATRSHINTLLENGKKVSAVFSIYKMKLTATKKSMNKSGLEDMTYEDISTVYTAPDINTKEVPIPQDVMEFWGKSLLREDVEFLEREYAQFKQTHSTGTYAEVVLLKEVCNTMLEIKKARIAGDDTSKMQKALQELMKNLAISPNSANDKNTDKGDEAIGLWIRDVEMYEPCEWLKNDPRGDAYRDVMHVDEYFEKFFVRPNKNFVTGSKDFNVEDSVIETDDGFDDEVLSPPLPEE